MGKGSEISKDRSIFREGWKLITHKELIALDLIPISDLVKYLDNRMGSWAHCAAGEASGYSKSEHLGMRNFVYLKYSPEQANQILILGRKAENLTKVLLDTVDEINRVSEEVPKDI